MLFLKHITRKAYYENDEPISITEEPVNPQGETLKELKRDFVSS